MNVFNFCSLTPNLFLSLCSLFHFFGLVRWWWRRRWRWRAVSLLFLLLVFLLLFVFEYRFSFWILLKSHLSSRFFLCELLMAGWGVQFAPELVFDVQFARRDACAHLVAQNWWSEVRARPIAFNQLGSGSFFFLSTLEEAFLQVGVGMVRWHGLMRNLLLLRIERLCWNWILAALLLIVLPASGCVSGGTGVGTANRSTLW